MGLSYQCVLAFTDELPILQPDKFRSFWARNSYRRTWHERVAAAVLEAGAKPPAPLEHAHVACFRFSSVEPDRVNCANSFKPILDGLKHAGVILDDKPRVLVSERYSWEKTKRADAHVLVEVRSAEPSPAASAWSLRSC